MNAIVLHFHLVLAWITAKYGEHCVYVFLVLRMRDVHCMTFELASESMKEPTILQKSVRQIIAGGSAGNHILYTIYCRNVKYACI